MDAFEKWADEQWYRGKGEKAPAPSMILIAKTYEEEARKAFRAGMRRAAEIARRYEPDERANYVTYASNDILAEADK